MHHVIELAILGVLMEQDLHGYEIRRRLRDDLGLFGASFGSLYPALARLERAGAVESLAAAGAAAGPPIPLTGSIAGEHAALRAASRPRSRRSRKVYRVTAEGRRLFERLLAEDPPSGRGERDAKGFELRLAFARYLPPAARLRLLERRRAHLADELETLRASATRAEGRRDRYGALVAAHAAELVERELAWLGELIALEHGAEEERSTPVANAAHSP
jgi:DNA-binding PadR family transcriptional regulator